MDNLVERNLLDSSSVNGYEISHWSDDTYTACDSAGKEIYALSRREDNNYVLKMRTKNNMIFSMVLDGSKPFDFSMFKQDCTLYSRSGQEVTVKDNVVVKKSNSDENGYYERIYEDKNIIDMAYNLDGEPISRTTSDNHQNTLLHEDLTDNTKWIYTDSGECYCVEYADGRKEYLDEEDPFIVNKDGTFEYKRLRGSYTVDRNGHYICVDEDNNQLLFDSLGHKYKEISSDGVVYEFDKDSQTVTKNGKTSVTAINHIEYDEEEYDNIMRQLTSIHDEVPEKIKSDYQNSVDLINSFEDKYSTATLNEVNSSVQNSLEAVNGLKECINYSLLVYQACDSRLRDNLNVLIDSLFDENESGLATVFKREVNTHIEDRDNDSILEYKLGTNFATLSHSGIVYSCFTDENGNKIYTTNDGTIIGLEGNEYNISYLGTPFKAIRDSDGIIRLIDENGKDIDIFGEYNISTVQYGSNQMNVEESYYDKTIINMLNDYYPNATMEEKVALLSKVTNSGCGYAAITNLIFKEFEGNESGFYEAYGFPMYDTVALGASGVCRVEYNYEAVILDLFCKTNNPQGINDINYVIQNGRGVGQKQIEYIYKYLKDTKGITLGSKLGPENIVTDRGYFLYIDGERLRQSDDSVGHMMIITDHDDDGNEYVSSWGRKCTYVKSNDDDYINRYNNIWKGVMNNGQL